MAVKSCPRCDSGRGGNRQLGWCHTPWLSHRFTQCSLPLPHHGHHSPIPALLNVMGTSAHRRKPCRLSGFSSRLTGGTISSTENWSGSPHPPTLGNRPPSCCRPETVLRIDSDRSLPLASLSVSLSCASVIMSVSFKSPPSSDPRVPRSRRARSKAATTKHTRGNIYQPPWHGSRANFVSSLDKKRSGVTTTVLDTRHV